MLNNDLKKRRLKLIILIFFTIFMIIWISLGLYLKLTISTHDKLESIGYSNIEISMIEDMLSKKDIEKVLKYPYTPNLINLLFEKEFNSNNLTKYLDYYEKNPDISNELLLYIVNNNLDTEKES